MVFHVFLLLLKFEKFLGFFGDLLDFGGFLDYETVLLFNNGKFKK
jgi:hypothetical protein